MAVKVVHVSDISGMEADEQALGRLVVHEHPEYADLPVTLEVLPEEVESLQGASRFVTVEWIAPGARKGERMTVSLDDFNLLGKPGVMESAIQDALIAKHRSRPRSARGTVERPGKNVRAKARLNRSILGMAWGKSERMLAYKCTLHGGELIKVDARHSSNECSRCRSVTRENRFGRSNFRGVACGHAADADTNAAQVLLARGLAARSGTAPGQ